MSNLDIAAIQRQLDKSEAEAAQLRQRLQEAQLASANAASHGHFNGNKLTNRSQSTMGYVQTTPPMMAPDREPKRQRRAMSQQSSQHMARSSSNRSDSGMPFRAMGPIQPLLAPNRSGPNAQEPLTPAQSQGTQALPDIGMNPDEFIAGLGDPQPYISSIGTSLSPADIASALPTSRCPSMVSGWSAFEGPSPMSRANSFFADPSIVGVDMSRFSSGSQSSLGFAERDMFGMSDSPNVGEKRPYADQDFLGVGIGASDMSRSFSALSQGNEISLPRSTNIVSPSDAMVGSTAMDRSASNLSSASCGSNASTKRRHKEALDRAIRSGNTTMLAPKPGQTAATASTNAPAKKAGKVPLHKNTYQRRKPTKVYCTQCSDHKEGFRGDHELRRHISAKHEGVVCKFICRDPASVGIHSNLQHQLARPLSECKQCIHQKQYGAYYNAAAHLRRQHFKPRASRGSKGKSDGKPEEKRGGKGGGDWPPMDELKLWFEKRKVSADNSDALDDDQEDLEANATEFDTGPSLDDYTGMESNMNPLQLGDGLTACLDGQTDGASIFPMTPISPAPGTFSFAQYSEGSPVQSMLPSYDLSGNGQTPYGSMYDIMDPQGEIFGI